MSESQRSRAARSASEAALVRIVHHYGGRPDFVVLGGLVPDWLCAGSARRHAGTTDVDVQVNLEVALGASNAGRLEDALRKAEFEPDSARIWRWVAGDIPPQAVVKFELLADLDDQPNEASIRFDACKYLGALNLRGTRFAARDVEVRSLSAIVGDTALTAEINVSGLAGFLLAKAAAARSRRKPKDWYDIAFVLLHNDRGGPIEAANAVRSVFGENLGGAVRTSLDDLLANFGGTSDQGPSAYAAQMHLDHPEIEFATHAADAVLAIEAFHQRLFTAD